MAARPEVYCEKVNDRITAMLAGAKLPPTLAFLDPFGYKGLTNRLIQAVLKDFGSDVIFFFNYNRVNAAIDNGCVEEHIEALFDLVGADVLRRDLDGLDSCQREQEVMRQLEDALKNRGHARYVRHFTFLNETGSRTSHRIVFATKHRLGAKIMKGVMAAAGGWEDHGVPLYCYGGPRPTLSLFDPLSELTTSLLEHFAGQSLTVEELYMTHGLDLPYTEANYKTVLLGLEADGRVVCDKPASLRRSRSGRPTLADSVTVRFVE
jgi:hypothetical protein